MTAIHKYTAPAGIEDLVPLKRAAAILGVSIDTAERILPIVTIGPRKRGRPRYTTEAAICAARVQYPVNVPFQRSPNRNSGATSASAAGGGG